MSSTNQKEYNPNSQENPIPPTPYNSPENTIQLKSRRSVCGECDEYGCMNCYEYGIFCLNCRDYCNGERVIIMDWDFFSLNTSKAYFSTYEEFLKENMNVYETSPILAKSLILSEQH